MEPLEHCAAPLNSTTKPSLPCDPAHLPSSGGSVHQHLPGASPQQSLVHISWSRRFTRNPELWVSVDFHFLFHNTASCPHWNAWWIHLYKPSGKNILGIIHFVFFKGSESWPNQNQFPPKLSKVLPNESCKHGQMSVLKWAIQILIFKCFHDGKKYWGFFIIFTFTNRTQASHRHLLNYKKRVAFLKQRFTLRREKLCQSEKR